MRYRVRRSAKLAKARLQEANHRFVGQQITVFSILTVSRFMPRGRDGT